MYSSTDPSIRLLNHPFFRVLTYTRIPRIVLFILIGLYIIVFGLLATRQHLAYQTGALDLGNYDQALWNAAHGRGLTLTLLPGISFHRMGLHVEPILYLLIPFYRLWPNPLVLLWVQTLALGLAAWPLFLLARRRLGADWLALAIALAYLLLPATQSVNLFDFHAVALSPLFMLWALYFLDIALAKTGSGSGFWLDRRPPTAGQPVNQLLRFTPALLFLLLAMATKEDISLHVFMIGLYVMFLRQRWRIGMLIALIGLVWAFVAFGLVIPAYRSGDQSAYVGFFPDLGDNPLEIALSPITKPLIVWELLTRRESIAALGMVTLPFACLNLLGWPIFILAVPSLAISMLSNNPLQQQLETWHYAAPMLPFISLAAADGLARLGAWSGKSRGAEAQRRRGEIAPLHILTVILLLTSGGYHYFRGYSPLSKPFLWPEVTAHHRLGDELAAAIPQSARVLAQAELVPRVSQREQVSIWRGDLPPDYDYVFMDVSHPKFVNRDNAQAIFFSTFVRKKYYGLIASKDGYLLLKHGSERIPTQVGFQDFLFADPSWRDRPGQAQFGDLFSLVGQEVHLNRQAEPQMTLYFHVLRRPEEDYFFRLYLLNDQGIVEGATVFQQPVLIWWPTHLWQPGEVIKVRFNTLPWWTGDGQHPRFSYALGISPDTGSTDEPWDVALRLPITGERVLPDKLVHLQDFRRIAGMVYMVTNDE